MRTFLRTAWAFLRRDFLEESSYRLNFLLGIGTAVVTLLFLTFVSDFFGARVTEQLARYGGDYFAFLVLGIAVQSFLGAALLQISARIRRAQTLGTLEALLATRTPIPTILVCLPLYPFLKTSLRVAGYLVLGVVAFHLEVRLGSLHLVLLVFLLTMTAFGSLGLVMAGLTVAFKRVEPLSQLVTGLSLFVGGVYYPVDVLPGWVQSFARLLPITPALEGLRRTLLGQAGWAEVSPSVLSLLAFCVVVLPLGVLTFRWALRRALRDGTLTQY